MRLLKLLLSSSIIYIAAMAMENSTNKESDVVQHNALNYNLSDNILPLHYNIELNFISDILMSESVITIYIIYATQHINFYVSNSLIKSTLITRSELKQNNNGMIYEPVSIKYNYENNIVAHNFNAILLPGIYNLHIWYQIPINIVRKSFCIPYTNKYGNKKWLITIGIQSKKHKIFPFWNKPELRISFDISIKHHREDKVLSNMLIKESISTYSNSMYIWTYFNKITLISMDDVAFVMSNFHQINLTNTISMYCRPQLIPYVKFASYIIQKVTIYLENYWGNSKRFLEWTIVSSESKVDHVVIPNLQDKVKQILGFVFHRETDITYKEEFDSIGRKTIIAPLIAREMIQKYIGNLLNPSNWFQLWLNEGFIIFLQTYIINEVVSNFQMMNLFIVQMQHELFNLNTYVNINSVIEYDNYPENDIYTSFSHIKSSIIWRMLERTLTPDKFAKSINIYLNNQYAEPMETTFDNLWNAMQSIVDELDSEYQFNVKRTVHSWAMQRCFPVLEVMRNYSNNIVTISAQFHDKLDEERYYIPITYTTERNPNFTKTWSNIWLTSSHSKIELYLEKSIDQWIIFNLQHAGYYRVYYDTENWRKIARYLNSEKYRNIHVLNRAQIINDAFHFAIEKKLKFSLFWELAAYLQKETDYIAWYPMLKAFEFISNIFPFLEFKPQFKKMLRSFEFEWEILFKNDTNIDNIDHVKYLKQELAKWKCILDDISCIRRANHYLEWNLIYHTRNKFSSNGKRWTWCNGLKMANNNTWNKVYDDVIKEIDYTILECLAYIKNPKIMISYLEKLSNVFLFYINLPNQFKPIERAEAVIANIYLSTLAKNTKNILEDTKLNNFRKFTYIYGKINEIAALIVIINNVYSIEQFDEIKKFIKKEFEESIFSDVERKIKTRMSEIERQTQFLQSLFID